MPPIETRLTNPIGRIEAASLGGRAAPAAGKTPERPVKSASTETAVVLGDTLDPGETPINEERVAQIRKALADGSYPVIPTTVADAIIAAGLILRSAQ